MLIRLTHPRNKTRAWLRAGKDDAMIMDDDLSRLCACGHPKVEHSGDQLYPRAMWCHSCPCDADGDSECIAFEAEESDATR